MDIARDGNLFPREDLLEAVARSDWRDRAVPVAAWLCAAFGAALVAAGLPISRLVVRAPVEVAAAMGSPAELPVHGAIAAVGRLGIGIEAAFFLGAALAFGASLLAVGLALRAGGFGGRLAFASTAIAVASPLLLLHARLPSDFPFAALAGSLVLAAILAPHDPDRGGVKGYALRVAIGLLAAIWLHRASLALLAPAVAAVAGKLELDGVARSIWHIAVLLGVALASALLAASIVVGTTGPLLSPWIDLALAGGAGWVTLPLAYLHTDEEEPPPLWIALWAAAVVLAVILADVSAAALLVPLFGLLIANALARRARPDGALRWAIGLGALQLALGVAAALIVPRPAASFAAVSRGQTRPGDVVVVDDLDSTDAYLLRRRLGLGVVDEGAIAGTARTLSLGRPRDGVELILDATTGEVSSVE